MTAMPKLVLIPLFLFLNAILFSLIWIGFTIRNESILMYATVFSLALGALLLLIQLVCYLVVKDAQFRRLSMLSLIAGLVLVCGAFSGAPAVKSYRFQIADRKVLERAVAEVRATGQSTAWKSVAYDMRVYPTTGPVQEIYFCIARDRGYDCQWYRWTEKVYPTPDPPGKAKPRSNEKARVANHYWLSPQWSEYTTL